MTFGEKLIKLRLKAKLTTIELAKLSGISQVSILNYERNTALPALSRLQKLAEALGVTWLEFQGCEILPDNRRYSGKFPKNKRKEED